MKMFVFLSLFLLTFTLVPQVHAASSYVLPYPGVMPGNRLYVFSDFLDKARGVYVFGDIASFKYNLSQSDKYLVEAKILFEYDQYLLAVQSLEKSNSYFIKSYKNVMDAQKHNKNTEALKDKHAQAALKHVETLSGLKMSLPEIFTWEAEKSAPETIRIYELLNRALKIRQQYE